MSKNPWKKPAQKAPRRPQEASCEARFPGVEIHPPRGLRPLRQAKARGAGLPGPWLATRRATQVSVKLIRWLLLYLFAPTPLEPALTALRRAAPIQLYDAEFWTPLKFA